MKAPISPVSRARFQRRQVVEGNIDAFRQQRAEALAEDLGAVQRQGAVGQAVESLVAVEDARPAGGHAGELDGRLHRLGAGIAEKGALHARQAGQQLLRQDAGQQRDVELHQPRQLCVQHLAQGRGHRGVVASQGEDAEAAQQVEVAAARHVVEVRALAAREVDVVAQSLQHAHQLRVQVLLVQGVLLALALGQDRGKIEGHDSIVLFKPPQAIELAGV